MSNSQEKFFFLWVGQIFPVSWTNFFRVLTLSFYWSCKQLFQLSCPSGLLLAIITYCYDSLKFLEKSRKFEKAFCWCYCSGFTLFGENLPRVILIFPSYLGWKKGISQTFRSLGLRPWLQKPFTRCPFFNLGNLEKSKLH